MFNLKTAPIRRKLKLLFSLCILFMLLVAGSILAVNAFFSNRAVLLHEVNALAEITGQSIIPALIFDDDRVAKKTLDALQVQKDIVYAAAFKQDSQKPIAVINKKNIDLSVNEKLQQCPQYEFSLQQLYMCKQLVLDDENQGYLILVVSLQSVYQQLGHQILMALIGLSLSSVFIFWVMDRFSQKLVEPILELLAISEEVAASGRFDKRAEISQTNDEIGRLGKAFNSMLEKTAYWHDQLLHQKEILEEMVEKRTLALIDAKNKAMELAEHAQKANLAKSDFLSMMSHEIRTPLNAIIGFSGLMRTTDLDPKQQEFIQIIKQSANALLVQVNDILDFSKIEAGKMELDSCWFDLYALLIAVKHNHYHVCTLKAVYFDVSMSDDVPRYVYGDCQKLKQILFNLLSNAIKFTDQGFVKLDIRSAQKQAELCQLEFSVSDSGIGIASDKLPHLFEPFTQADSSTTREFGGTGLGLAISQRMVELLGGDIAVNSHPGQGTTFTCQIPLILPTQNEHLSSLQIPLIGLSDSCDAEVMETRLHDLGYSVEVLNKEQRQLLQKQPEKALCYALLLLSVQDRDELDFWLRYNETATQKVTCACWAMTPELIEINHNRPELPCLYLKDDRLSLVEDIDGLITTDLGEISFAHHTGLKPVLLVEDNEINRQMTKNILIQAGLSVEIATNGQQAVALFKHNDYSLVLMDCHMPIMDGLTATQRIRQDKKNKPVPIIALTADAFTGNQKACLEAGMNDFLSKPFSRVQLLKKVEHWLLTPIIDNKTQNTIEQMPQHSLSTVEPVSTHDNRALLAQIEALINQIEKALASQDMAEIECATQQFKAIAVKYKLHKLVLLLDDLEKMVAQGKYFKAVKQWKPIIDAVDEIKNSGLG